MSIGPSGDLGPECWGACDQTICGVVASTQTEAGFGDPVYESAVEAATLLSTAADPSRMTILKLLVDGKTCVCTFKAHIPIAPSVLSYHLKVLRDAGLIVGKRRGRWVEYELIDDAFERLRRAIPMTERESGGSSPQSSSGARRSSAHPRTRTWPTGTRRQRHGRNSLPRDTSEATP
jgi:ArsR family transcriptional regulator